MRILVTNDDGIHSEGLDICAEIARAYRTTSGSSRRSTISPASRIRLSLNDPLRLRQVGDRRYAVRGTPTDCVIMGVRHVLDGKQVDLVLSGVNRGRNVGEDVIYSGTVAGAMEGALLGIPSLALSQSYNSRSGKPPFWETGLRFAPDIIRGVLANSRQRHAQRRSGQYQFPDCAPEEVKGIAVRAARAAAAGAAAHRQAPRWPRQSVLLDRLFAQLNAARPEHGTDMAALDDRCIAVTPLKIDITDEPTMTRLAALFEKRLAERSTWSVAGA